MLLAPFPLPLFSYPFLFHLLHSLPIFPFFLLLPPFPSSILRFLLFPPFSPFFSSRPLSPSPLHVVDPFSPSSFLLSFPISSPPFPPYLSLFPSPTSLSFFYPSFPGISSLFSFLLLQSSLPLPLSFQSPFLLFPFAFSHPLPKM